MDTPGQRRRRRPRPARKGSGGGLGTAAAHPRAGVALSTVLMACIHTVLIACGSGGHPSTGPGLPEVTLSTRLRRRRRSRRSRSCSRSGPCSARRWPRVAPPARRRRRRRRRGCRSRCESFFRVDWVAVPQALRARRLNDVGSVAGWLGAHPSRTAATAASPRRRGAPPPPPASIRTPRTGSAPRSCTGEISRPPRPPQFTYFTSVHLGAPRPASTAPAAPPPAAQRVCVGGWEAPHAASQPRGR
eukprot:COSAG01_NODE_99_length_26583_cov_79.512536_3_plen_245_part_00